MLSGFKERVYDVLGIKDPDDRLTQLVNGFIIVIVLVNLFALFLQTFEDVATRYAFAFQCLEIFSVAAFTVEYLLRVWVADLDPTFAEPIVGRLRYMFTDILAIVDLLAILPFYVELYLPGIVPIDLLAIRALRLFRLARLFKLTRYSDSLDTIVRVITEQREFLLITFTIQMVLLLVSSVVMYFLEHEAQPEKFNNIFGALMWGLNAMTLRIGYPDIYPITPLGKVAGAVLGFVEIVAMALPIGVITAGIEQEMKIARENEARARKEQLRQACMAPRGAAGKKRP